MQTRTCNSAIWNLVLLAIILLTLRGQMGLLALVVPISLLLACAMAWLGNHHSQADARLEKR